MTYHHRHGTPYMYSKLGCRCDLCSYAKSEYCKKNKADRLAGHGQPIPHGTPRGYDIGCKCDPCTYAMSEYARGVRTNSTELREQIAARNAIIIAERDRLARLVEALTRP